MSTTAQKQFRFRVSYGKYGRFVNAISPTEAIDKLRAVMLAMPLQPGEEPDADLATRDTFRKKARASISMRG